MFKLISRLFVALAFLAVTGNGLAFTPNDVELAAQMRAAYGGLSSWKAQVTYPEYPDVATTVWWSGGKWRQEWTGVAGQPAVAVGVGGGVLASCPAAFPVNPVLAFMPTRPVEAWKAWGVDNATRQYGFCGDSPCFIMGADVTDETLPAIRLDNETMAPLLLRLGGAVPSTVTFGDYAVHKGFALPGSGEVIFADGSTLAFTVTWTDLLQADDPGLYDASTVPGGALCLPPGEPFGSLLERFRIPSK